MALSKEDKTKPEVLELFKKQNKGYVPGYIRIFSYNLNNTCNSFSAVLKMYASKEARDEDPYSGNTIEMGGNIPDSAMKLMAKKDNREILYKYIEAFAQVNEILSKNQITPEMTDEEKNAVIEENNLQIDEIYDTLSIEKA